MQQAYIFSAYGQEGLTMVMQRAYIHPMKINITLSGSGGILDTRNIDTADDDSAEVSTAIFGAIDDWVLAPGDTIRISEVAP
jgi:hypothetical protein